MKLSAWVITMVAQVWFAVMTGTGAEQSKAIMDNDQQTLELLVVGSAPADNLTQLRQIEMDGRPVLLASATGLVPRNPHQYQTMITALPSAEGRNPELFMVLPQLLPVPPAWDSTACAGKAPVCVAESAGGALNSLFLQVGGAARIAVTGGYPLESFSKPRFIRQQPPAPAPVISAILENKTLVVFPAAGQSGYGKYIKLTEASEALLIKVKSGFAAILKRTVSGPARHGLLPGNLFYAMFDDTLRPVGPLKRLSPEQSVYEFDADLVANTGQSATFLVAATTPTGLVVTLFNPVVPAKETVSVVGAYLANASMRPSVLVKQLTGYVAVIDKYGTRQANVRLGHFPLRP